MAWPLGGSGALLQECMIWVETRHSAVQREHMSWLPIREDEATMLWSSWIARSCRLFGIAAPLVLASCAAAPQPGRTGPSCLIAGSSEWCAWMNAMPGADGKPMLIVTGKVMVPTGGYRPSLVLEQVAESHPVQVFTRLHPNPPGGGATQAIGTHEVRSSWPMSTPVGSVTVRCGSRVLAQISPIETAY